MNKKNNLSESLEDYLETILALEDEKKVARSKDIADNLGIQRGSVTGALKNLAKKNLINYEPYGFVTLTAEGKKIAKKITHRHRVIKDFLFRILQVSADKAEETACKIEHALDETTFKKFVKFISFIDECPRTGTSWIDSFVNHSTKKTTEEKKCRECIQSCLEEMSHKSAG